MTQEEFTAVVRASSFTDLEIAKHCTVARPTVTRWREGKSMPHPVVAPWIADHIKDMENPMKANPCKGCHGLGVVLVETGEKDPVLFREIIREEPCTLCTDGKKAQQKKPWLPGDDL